jgi:hypothetical protein
MLDDLTMFWRFATGLGRFLRTPLSPADCRRIVEESLRGRERSLLLLLRKAVFGCPKSPYLALFRWAGIEYGDVEQMVTRDGVEAAMERLYDAGIWVGLEESKGRRPIVRPGLTLEVTDGDFDNPLLSRDFEVQSGGSTGPRRRMAIDFGLLTYDAACKYVFHQANGVEARPFAIWRAVPPGSSGLKNALMAAKYGQQLERWFSPMPVSWKPDMFKSAVFTTYAVYAARLWGFPVPVPEYVPLDAVSRIAAWLAEKVRQRAPALLSGPANHAARVCIAAKNERLDISGTVFRVGGEPFTPAKLQLLSELGARSMSGWAMSESGPLAGGCAAREFLDEVHLYSGKVAVFQRPKLLSDGESRVEALYLTTLLTSAPKIMLNLDTGDYGVLSRRRCGCPLEKLGLDTHLHTIRNYEKLTTAGMNFMGSEFMALVEEVLPAAHGGHPTDYQFVEEEQGALNRVSIVVSPRVGQVDEEAIVQTILGFLSSHSRGDKAMARHWQQGGVLTVARREPYVTAAGKIPPLRILRKQDRLDVHPGGPPVN